MSEIDMKKIKIFPVFLLLFLFLSVWSPSALALDDPQVTAKAVLLADADSGRIFFSQNADMKMYPASLTKIMTVLLAVEAVDRGDVSLDDEVTCSEECLAGMDEDGSTANIVAGETMKLRDLMYCALVESANEACNVIAEYIGGSIGNFVQMMNDRAGELGCTGTHFANTHGLPDENHYTTAADMYLITMEAINQDLFMEICNTAKYTVSATNMTGERELSNTNGLINADSPYYKGYYYEYARGVKTGHTSAAGYCLISTAEKDGMHLVAVVLGGIGTENGDGSLTYGNFVDTISLYDWVFNNFSIHEILKSSELVCEVDVAMGADGDSVTLRPKDVVTALLPNDVDTSAFERKITIYSDESGEELAAPVDAGEVLGEITVSKDGVVYGSTYLVASTSVELSKTQYMKEQVRTALDLVWVKIIFWLLIIILIVYALLVIRYRTLHKRHQKEARRARQERERRREEDEMTRIFKEGESRKKTPSPPKPPAEGPKVDYFSKEDVKARHTVKIGSTMPDKDQEKRDYFEEFFRQRREEEKPEEKDRNK
ncbi:MAG: D-alanyl-D-alanine carboxypeptidase [Clostridia bacterium]|nr:D-alanyl-D-alanine carboxypeptidase [Clostridia bacterium]